jgi:enoyl-CoA hydratase/carnithine racemase
VEFHNIKLTREDSIATIRLNRPDALNALSPELLEEFSRGVVEVGRDEEMKALVVRGEGRAFCAGADLMFFDSTFENLGNLAPYVRLLNRCFLQLEELPIPTIALVHGFALAAGLELTLACDMVIAAEDARIGDQHINFGLMPGGGSTQRLPRRVGLQPAMELLTTGRWLSGLEAVSWGLALRSAPAEELEQALEDLVNPLRTKSRAALSRIKAVTLQGQAMPLRDGIALEGLSFVEYFATSPHPQQGIQAFKEKRQPEF